MAVFLALLPIEYIAVAKPIRIPLIFLVGPLYGQCISADMDIVGVASPIFKGKYTGIFVVGKGAYLVHRFIVILLRILIIHNVFKQ